MRTLTVFNLVSMDGYFVDARGDMSWAHKNDPEWDSFVKDNAKGGGELLFGRTTYEMMASYWPTPQARETDPIVAERMNSLPKVVFSRTMSSASWSNTRLVKGNLIEEVRTMKAAPGMDMVIFGSGTIVSQLTRAGLIDEYQLVVNPIVLGKGRTMFEGLEERLPFKRTGERAFSNGNVLLSYVTDRNR
jgi:dihydrofolate reductase